MVPVTRSSASMLNPSGRPDQGYRGPPTGVTSPRATSPARPPLHTHAAAQLLLPWAPWGFPKLL